MAPSSESLIRFLYIHNSVSLLLHCKTCMHAQERDKEEMFWLLQFYRMTCREKWYICGYDHRSNADKMNIKLHNFHIQKTSTFVVQLLCKTQQRNPVFYLTQECVTLVHILYILSLMDITLKIAITALLVTTDLQTTGHTQSIGIFMIYLPNQLHTHNFSSSLVMVNKPNHTTI